MKGSPTGAAIYFKLVLVALAWGGSFIAARVLTAEIAPVTAAFWRYVGASVALVLIAFALEGGLPRLNRQQWFGVVLLGATGVALFNLLFMIGLERVTASRGSLIVALNPAATLLGAALFLREPLTRYKAFGILLALFGVGVVLGHGDPRNVAAGTIGVGELALFGCVLAWATYTLVGKRILQGLSPIAATTYAALTGSAMLAVVAAGTGYLVWPQATWRGWVALAFIAVIGTALAFVWFYEGVRTLGPARAAVFINLVPVAAITLAVALLGEPLEASMLVGGALVVTGIYLINRAQRPGTTPPLQAAG